MSGNGVLEDTLSLFMVQAVIIICVTRFLSLGTKFLKQPRVIMEVVGGILLGPSALGHIPGYLDTVFPAESLGYLALVANLGLVLYLFLVGVELDPEVLRRNGQKAISIAVVGIALPFGLGCLISPLLFNKLLLKDPGYENAAYSSFLVFVGVAMSITAFPVLARILTESKLILSTAGVMTMGAAALNDAIAWCLLVLALSIVHSGRNKLTALFVFLAIAAYAIFLFVAVRPALQAVVRWVEMTGSSSLRSLLFALLICCIFISAWITAFLGVHAIFGSFLVGMIMPRDGKFTLHMCEKIDDLVSNIFLPLYFALSGLKTDIASIGHAIGVALLVLVVLMATAGKFIGCAGAARLNGIPWRESCVIGILMNTRGLVELIVLNLGLQAKMLDVEIFTIMVMMALITTFITSPLVEYIYPPHMRLQASVDSLKAMGTVLTPNGTSMNEEGVLVDNDMTEQTPRTAVPGDSFTTAVDGERKPVVEKGGGGVTGWMQRQRARGVGTVGRGLLLMKRPTGTSAQRLKDSLMSRTWRVGVVIERMKDLPETMSLLYLFAPIYSNNSQMDVTAMHFVETELNFNDVMIASHPEKAGQMDPALLAVNHFCRAIGAHIHCRTIFGNPHGFASDLVAIEKRAGLDIVLMPWRRPVAYLGDYYDRFVSKTLRNSTITVALMVPDPSGKTDMVRQVLVVLSGCPSDGDCVALTSRFALHSLVSITIMLMPAAQEQAERYADLLADVGPQKRFHNVNLLRLDRIDQVTGEERTHEMLMRDILAEASKKGENAYDLIVVGYLSCSSWEAERAGSTLFGNTAANSTANSAAPSRSSSPAIPPSANRTINSGLGKHEATSSTASSASTSSLSKSGAKPPRIPHHLSNTFRASSPPMHLDETYTSGAGGGSGGGREGGRERPPHAAYSPTAAVLRGVAEKVHRFGEGVRNSSFSRTFSSTKLHRDGQDSASREREGGREGGSSSKNDRRDSSRTDRRDSSNTHPSSNHSLNSFSALDHSYHHKHHKGVQEFGVIGEEIYSRMDIEAFLMIVRGFQPAETAMTSTSSVKLERPLAVRAAAAAAAASSRTVPPAVSLGGTGAIEGGRGTESALPPLSRATFQPPSPM